MRSERVPSMQLIYSACAAQQHPILHSKNLEGKKQETCSGRKGYYLCIGEWGVTKPFIVTVPAWHTVRSAGGSFFLLAKCPISNRQELPVNPIRHDGGTVIH